MADPLIRWAIKYCWDNGAESIDTSTVSYLRIDAWKAWEKDWLRADGTVHPKARARRRKRQVRAVRIRIEELLP